MKTNYERCSVDVPKEGVAKIFLSNSHVRPAYTVVLKNPKVEITGSAIKIEGEVIPYVFHLPFGGGKWLTEDEAQSQGFETRGMEKTVRRKCYE